MRIACLLFALVFSSCATSRAPIDLAHADIVDLTYAFDEHTLYWPSSPSGFELKRLAYGPTPGGYFYSSNAFSAPEHGGTHLDAPIHFAEHGKSVDQIPLRQLIAPAVVIDISSKTSADADYRLTRADVQEWEKKYGTIPSGAIVLLRTGWGSRYGNRKAYFGDDTPGATDKLHFPSYGADAAKLLVNERHVAAIGIDTASIDYGQSSDFIVHQIANGAGVPGLENIANLEKVPARGAWVIALPMKIAGGSGGPLRIVAL
ncbi:MAG TPA: cyclase family protein, partial [Thermoanaerobaculia bacterium]|nr:cyclase family protein [Thermoanaerobaculia bacterium]